MTLNTSKSSIQLSIVTDWRVLLFAASVAILTCVVFGTFPALRGTHADPISALKSGERGTTGGRERFAVQRLMVITQIAVSMVLLVGALLFVRSYRNLMTLDPGMKKAGITIGYFDYPKAHLKPENEAAFRRQLVDQVRAIPGIQNAAASTNVPLSGSTWSHEVHVDSAAGSSRFSYVSPSYFDTLGIPFRSGRNFNPADTTGAPFVLIVNQSFVRKYLGDSQPIGHLVHVMPEPQYPERTYEVVGVVADTKYNDLRREPEPIAFVPIDQLPVTAQGSGTAMLIASTDAPAAAAAVRHNLESTYPEMGLQFFEFQQSIEDGLVGDRMMAMLSGFFGLLAVLLVAVGLYGVLSYLITQRRNEIGIRIALGAHRWRVIALVMRDTAAMLIIGIAAGTLLALLAGRAATTMLFDLQAYDAVTMAFAITLLVLIAALASWLPARTAAHLDPVSALRSE